MRTDTPQTIYRKDYAAPNYLADTVEMGFDLDPADTHVATRITLTRNPAAKGRDLILFGEELELVALRLNGKTLSQAKGDFRIASGVLTLSLIHI